MQTLFYLVLSYLVLLAFIFVRQESLLFIPDKLPDNFQFNLPGTQEITLKVDGATLSALHLRLPNPRGVVFFLHGNAGNLDSWLTSTDFYRRVNFDLLMMDYRGYGKSSGRIRSEAQLHADVLAAWQWLAPQYPDQPIVIYGRSLGTALAAKLAAEPAISAQAALLILVSPYQNMSRMAREHYPWAPSFLLRYPLATDEALRQGRMPTLILHGANDTLISPDHARALAALRPDAELQIIADANHDDIHHSPVYLNVLSERLARLPDGTR